MKILWVKSDFLHPTQRGGQIRTLEILRRLHAEHEVHYIAYDNPAHPEGIAKAREYCSAAYPVVLHVPGRRSPAFLLQALKNLAQPLPLSLARYDSPQMRREIAKVTAAHSFDSIVCDFLAMAPNFEDLGGCVLFQHNVENKIWLRHAEHAGNYWSRTYFRSQYQRMLDYETTACRQSGHIIAVSDVDRDTMQSEFGVSKISVVPTGVDVDYFAQRPAPPMETDMVFVGAMDWMPNIDAMSFFVSDVLPLIRKRHPRCRLVIAGREPAPQVRKLAEADSLIRVTGTVPDIRPYLHGAAVSIVPIRIGGGTRLKIYEAMAAGVPIVSTRVGAEGLDYADGKDILLADTARDLAAACIRLLEDPELRRQIREGGLRRAEEFSWKSIGKRFEQVLRENALVMKS